MSLYTRILNAFLVLGILSMASVSSAQSLSIGKLNLTTDQDTDICIGDNYQFSVMETDNGPYFSIQHRWYLRPSGTPDWFEMDKGSSGYQLEWSELGNFDVMVEVDFVDYNYDFETVSQTTTATVNPPDDVAIANGPDVLGVNFPLNDQAPTMQVQYKTVFQGRNISTSFGGTPQEQIIRSVYGLAPDMPWAVAQFLTNNGNVILDGKGLGPNGIPRGTQDKFNQKIGISYPLNTGQNTLIKFPTVFHFKMNVTGQTTWQLIQF